MADGHGPIIQERRGPGDGSAAALSAVRERLVGALGRERERWILWGPVGLGCGIAVYFALAIEPPSWAGIAAVGIAALFCMTTRRGAAAAMPAALAALIVAVGFLSAQIRTWSVDAPVLHNRLGPVTVTGTIVTVSPTKRGRRLVIDAPAIERLTPDRTPARVRVTVRRGESVLRPGDRVRLRAVLMPPPRPAAPGAFDFARYVYFARIGAVGFAIDAPEVLAKGAEGGLAVAIARVRQSATARITEALKGPTGGIAAALLTGERGYIAPAHLSALRDAGLAHLLAISGLHLSLVAAILFFVFRGLLALFEGFALRRPIKKWAAVGALIGAFGYLLLTGGTVPTQRAFIMLGIILLAVLVDRVAITMRLVATAAAAILLLAPESLLSVSFQMSFSAVIALVAVYEALRDRAPGWRRTQTMGGRIALYLAGILLTTVVATLATAPFAIHHFNRLAVYGLAANMLAVPITAFWIMPWGLLSLILMPLGLESLALVPMGWGIDAVVALAQTVTSWPGSVVVLQAMPVEGLALAALGGLWMALWRGPWRTAGLPVVAAGVLSAALVSGPDVIVSGDGRLMAVRDQSGALVLSSQRRARYTGTVWLRRAGQERAPPWPSEAPRPGLDLRCDAMGCLYRRGAHRIALVSDPAALVEDCAKATVVISTEPIPRRTCRTPGIRIHRFDLWRRGAHALWVEGNAVRVESSRDHQGARPWTRRPESRWRNRRFRSRRFDRGFDRDRPRRTVR